MKKVNKKARFMTFYVLVLLILGLSVILTTVNVTKNKILAKTDEIMQNALVNIEECENEIKLRAIFDDELNNGFKKINVTNSEKEEFNSQMLNDKLVNLLIESKEYVDTDMFVKFDNGSFIDGQMFKSLYYYNNIKDMNFDLINSQALARFGKYIDKSNVSALYNGESVLLDLNTYHKDYILKLRDVYYNENEKVIDLYFDSIYPSMIEDLDEYRNPKKIDYNTDEVIYIYKITLKKVGNSYQYLAIDRYDTK